MPDYQPELTTAIAIGIEAGAEVRRLYDANLAAIYIKADESPVTDADLASDRIIRARLVEHFPHDAILTEEGIDNSDRLRAERCWIVDPIDGTQQFVDRTGQFDVLIALVVGGRPVVAVMLQPATGFYLAASARNGAIAGFAGESTTNPVRLAKPDLQTRVGTTVWLGAPQSLPYLHRFAERLTIDPPRITQTGLIARGHLDRDSIRERGDNAMICAYPSPIHGFVGLPIRGDGTMAWEWDFAAADLIINESGGRFTDWHGQVFIYNKHVPRNEGGLVIGNTPEFHARSLEAIAPDIEAINASRGKE